LTKAKDDFISIASHQLRTPATAVKQYLGMMLQNYAGRLTKRQRSYAEIAYDSNERQLRLIGLLLQVARLDAGKLRLQKARNDVRQLTADIARFQAEELKKQRQTLVLEIPKQRIYAPVDREYLRMVLENIIENAGKYSPPGGQIMVGLARDKGLVRWQITDVGIGIAKHDQTKLFQKFSRLDNSYKDTFYGSGLGLYWAKKIIDLHGGSIKLESALNRGSTFTIELPTGR
jgi:signal transduction histidine kinase